MTVRIAVAATAPFGADVLERLASRHEIIGDVRGTGAFWAVELVRDRVNRQPLVPYNASGEANAPMVTFGAACRRLGLLPFIHMNRTHVVPALNIPDEEARYGLELLDLALTEVEASL